MKASSNVFETMNVLCKCVAEFKCVVESKRVAENKCIGPFLR